MSLLKNWRTARFIMEHARHIVGPSHWVGPKCKLLLLSFFPIWDGLAHEHSLNGGKILISVDVSMAQTNQQRLTVMIMSGLTSPLWYPSCFPRKQGNIIPVRSDVKSPVLTRERGRRSKQSERVGRRGPVAAHAHSLTRSHRRAGGAAGTAIYQRFWALSSRATI